MWDVGIAAATSDTVAQNRNRTWNAKKSEYIFARLNAVGSVMHLYP